MSFSKLPRELVLSVVDDLPTDSLAHLLRTCRSLYELLAPALATRITTEQLASTILCKGIANNYLPTVCLALAHDAPWHWFDDDGSCYSAIGHACDLNHLEIVGLLITHYGVTILNNNQDPRRGDRHDDLLDCHDNLLENAICHNNLSLTAILLEHNASVNPTFRYGYPSCEDWSLDFAVRNGSVEMVELVIKYGADVTCADRSLTYALNRGRRDMANVLLLNGVLVLKHDFEWSGDFPVGERSTAAIEAWITAGVAHLNQSR